MTDRGPARFQGITWRSACGLRASSFEIVAVLAIGPSETRNIADQIERLREAGLSIVLISHDLHDVMALADRIVVMRSGHAASMPPQS